MIMMVIVASVLSIIEFILYPIVKFIDPVLFTYHR
jgi:hypothetical protein